MIIDAFRDDFLFRPESLHVNYSQALLKNHSAIGYHIKTSSPTVTMPRIKVKP